MVYRTHFLSFSPPRVCFFRDSLSPSWHLCSTICIFSYSRSQSDYAAAHVLKAEIISAGSVSLLSFTGSCWHGMFGTFKPHKSRFFNFFQIDTFKRWSCVRLHVAHINTFVVTLEKMAVMFRVLLTVMILQRIIGRLRSFLHSHCVFHKDTGKVSNRTGIFFVLFVVVTKMEQIGEVVWS